MIDADTLRLAHGAIELCGAALCFLNFKEAWRRYRASENMIFNFCVAYAFGLNVVEEVLHGTLPVAYPYLVTNWSPLTFATMRCSLLIVFVCGVVLSSMGVRNKRTIAVAVSMPLLSFTLVPPLGAGLSFVYSNEPIFGFIHRPLDAVLAVGYLAVFLIFKLSPKASDLLPRRWGVFCLLGSLVHVLMVLSVQSLDSPFMLSHLMMLVEYVVWFWGGRLESVEEYRGRIAKKINAELQSKIDDLMEAQSKYSSEVSGLTALVKDRREAIVIDEKVEP